ncbi:39S ribosomal protein L38: mitochondrial-like protein [Dinothrombium tinctorium]|uniref:Large ribosomal subunit protein mL38 n=1 Tax=Dinothrombium tinctorium TaxID=1965070 RepID=A0A443RM44_9ACAR|nr:39S ribosomal protein L38: mitochondrial-like protein [Dinothrombium tinctorium]
MNKTLISSICAKHNSKCLFASPKRAQIWSELSLTRRNIRVWRKGLPFPPNFKDSHHFFLPSLKQYLSEKQAIENPVKLIDIGEKVEKKPVSRKEKLLASQNSKNATVEHEDDVLNLLSAKKADKSFNYKLFSQRWALSVDGQSSIVNTAHHYAIFRDLFSYPSLTPVGNEIPKIKLYDYYPRREKEMVKIVGDWFPGAVRTKYPEPKPIYFFSPIVPLYIEFALPSNEVILEDEEAIEELYKKENNIEKDNSGGTNNSETDTIEVSAVYRGNIIRPQFAKYKPSIAIDARNMSKTQASETSEIHVDECGIKIVGDPEEFYTLVLLNLDSQFGDSHPICHWQVTNIKYNSENKSTSYEETVSYLPVYGIRGLGYHRYVFVLYKHEKALTLPQIDDFDLSKRSFNPMSIIKDEKAVPVGLSWFQTTWDHSCQNIFHNILNMRAPAYEWIQPAPVLQKQIKFPERTPFNIYLDYYRDPKEINKSVLMERLNSVHPFEYCKDLEPRTLPANIYKIDYETPCWMKSDIWKRRNRLGPFRMLRPSSALIPLNNNADLDKPFWPHASKLNFPLRWPRFRARYVALRETRWSKPPQEHPSVRIDFEDIHETRQKEDEEEKKFFSRKL